MAARSLSAASTLLFLSLLPDGCLGAEWLLLLFVCHCTRWSGASADTSPPPLFVAGTELHGAGYGGLVDASSALKEPEHIMIYFSAHCK